MVKFICMSAENRRSEEGRGGEEVEWQPTSANSGNKLVDIIVAAAKGEEILPQARLRFIN